MEPDAYIGSKQERRDKKRKHSVVDLFSRKKPKIETPDRPIKKEPVEIVDTVSTSEADNSGFYDSGAESFRGFDDSKTKIVNKAYKKKKESPPRPDNDLDDDYGPEWIDGEPQGVESFTVDGNSGEIFSTFFFCLASAHIEYLFFKFKSTVESLIISLNEF